MKFSNRQFRAAVIAATVVAGVLAYANTFSNGFVWDDVSSILLHKHVQDPSKIAQLFREDLHAFGQGQGNFYRPLLAVSFMVDFALSRPTQSADAQTLMTALSPFVFHLSNLLWHLVAAVMLFGVVSRLGAPRVVQAVLPVLYVLHPLHTEAVAYISGRADPMAAAFMYGALWCALVDTGYGRRGLIAAIASLVLFVCALLTKESATIFPVLLGITLFFKTTACNSPKPVSVLKKYRALRTSLLILGAYALFRGTALHFADTTTEVRSLGVRLVETLQALALYARLVVFPVGLHMERTLEAVPGWIALPGLAILLGLVGAAIGFIRTKRSRAAIGVLWFLAAWLPISGVFPLNAPMAEHWMYVPLAGLLWATLELAEPFLRTPLRFRVVCGCVCLYALVLLGLTVERNRDWRDNESIYLATLRENPDTIRVHYNLAVTYDSLLNNVSGARREYEKVLQLYAKKKGSAVGTPNEPFWDDELDSHLSLANIYMEQQDLAKAVSHFETILHIKPTERQAPLMGKAAFGLGQCYLATGRMDQAKQQFQRALQYKPDLKPQVQRILGSFG